jgi:hypothetical protein
MPVATLREVLSRVKCECEALCKIVPSPSALHSASVAELKEMQWELIVDDLKARAPVLLSILTEAASSGSGSLTRTPSPAIISMAAAVLLKGRFKNMCKLQAMVGTLLYAGHASKRVSYNVYACSVYSS